MNRNLTKERSYINQNAIALTSDPIYQISIPSKNSIVVPVKHKPHVLIVLTVVTLLIALVASFMLAPAFDAYRVAQLNTTLGRVVTYTALSLLAIELSMFGYFVALYFKYKPQSAVADEALPTVTVIVPAYNEGRLVYDTLWSLAKSDYPTNKIEILAIDDGSKDDTWSWMLKAKNELGNRVTVLQQPENKGKRHALYRGFNLGTGSVFVTVDSDSVVNPDTLRNLVTPFVGNESCGAVAGNVKVWNREHAAIPKMLNISFAFSFEFVRSAQSVLGSVFCTPGALAAYRKDAVMNCLEDWINQKFLGKASDIGEDRAITNMILKQGLEVKFQSNAVVYTNTPEKYQGLRKMYTRWERSNVRENIAMSKFVFKNFRSGNKSGTRIIFAQQWFRMLLAYPTLLMMLYFLVTAPVLFLVSALVGILIFSSIQALFFAYKYNVKQSLWAYTYSILFTFGLFWITPYALATAGKGGWLTRELPG